ncbi:hypothetical protein JK361_18655 [Streptomyces sp. 5-8]|uniref:Serine/threonine protein kinase n=1 Tax=Streptomyces musisoli TaxID=2802280 RepID=A0ABS1P2K0_9ACTN|nr:hypothetical protein [Streptomyces musisoli]MBL1106595.1 hypothetical protein [Streptomyces musisoli]
MDYCIPCNRTLNGAVTCPECGAFDSGMGQPSERRDGAPAVDAAMPVVRSSGEPGSPEFPLPGPPTAVQDLVADRYDDRPSRLRKYAVQSLAAAAFTILGGLATASVILPSAAPRAASVPEPPPAEPEVRITDSPASPERVPTHPARKGVRDRSSDRIRRPLPQPARSKSPVSRPPVAATTSAPPPAKEKPTPRPSSSRRPSPPTRTATPTPRPSATPSGSISASPTSSGSPSSTAEAGG